MVAKTKLQDEDWSEQPKEKTLSERLDEAAALLLSQLIPAVRDNVGVISEMLGITKWMLICGTVVHQHEAGLLVSPSLDSAWRDGPLISSATECRYCHTMFEPVRYGQPFCSDLCGGRFESERIAKERRERELREAGLTAERLALEERMKNAAR